MPALVQTSIPSRLDRLPWTRFHWLIVIALGATWILDGLEVTLAGALGAVLTKRDALGLTDAEVGASATVYLAGAVIGALVFGYLTDRLGRKRLFYITVAVYLVGTGLTGLSWNFPSYALLRFVTGAGIGGEYAAINSAIDELIPARVRGRVDLIINSTYWIGAAAGSAGIMILLNPTVLPIGVAWRLVFGIGAVLGLIVMYFRHWVPESPRWLLIHGKGSEADQIVEKVEQSVSHRRQNFPNEPLIPITIRTRTHTAWREVWQAIGHRYRRRAILGFVLMVTQAFFYNAIFFTYGLVLMRFYGVPAERVSAYLLPFALGNVLGPVLIGHLFDTVGRKKMITLTYVLSGVLLAVSGYAFQKNLLTAQTQTVAWSLIFFCASAAASSAYLTVSEIFPLELRAFALAIFYSIGTFAGGVFAPWLFGAIIGTGSRGALAAGYNVAAALMIAGGAVEAWIGVAAERQSLESIAAPLSLAEEFIDEQTATPFRQ
jgi:MFS family permease